MVRFGYKAGFGINMIKMYPLLQGTFLQGGKYRIIQTLGQGGFGITYEAEQIALGRRVAIKEFFMKEFCDRDGATSHVTLGTTAESKEIVGRFQSKFIREAQMIARLDNPHIIRIHEIFEENGTVYYVMAFLEGGSLADKVKQSGPLPEKEAIEYVRQVGDALSYLHGRNILHLDVKPSNILLNSSGEAVLIDFGISKHYDTVGGQTSTTPVGISRGYAPIEQYQQGSVSKFSPATDIYSLGATMYYMLSGQTPPEAAEVNEDGLPEIVGISSVTIAAITKAMSPIIKTRPQDVKSWLDLLNNPAATTATAEQTIIPPKKEEESKKQNRIIFTILVVVAFFLFIFLMLMPRGEHEQSVNISSESIKRTHILVNNKERDTLFCSSSAYSVTVPIDQNIGDWDVFHIEDDNQSLVEIEQSWCRLVKITDSALAVYVDENITSSSRTAFFYLGKKYIPNSARAIIVIHQDPASHISKTNGSINKTEDLQNNIASYQDIDEPPSFYGGDVQYFSNWVSTHIVYPKNAVENGLQGRVTIGFTIETDGSVSNVVVLRGVDPVLDKEAIRVVSSSPKWKPAKQRGRAVRVSYTMPIIFQLE